MDGRKCFVLTRSKLNRFFNSLLDSGKAESTVAKYKRDIEMFCDFLGDSRRVNELSLPLWREKMAQEGYALASINSGTSAINSLYKFMGRRNWQVAIEKKPTPADSPANGASEKNKIQLSRSEYMQLLQAAKQRDNIKIYLMIKVFACVNLNPGDVCFLTREAVNSGVVEVENGKKTEKVYLPDLLREDLIDYARHKNIQSGPLFINSSGKCYDRSTITKMISSLAENIGMAPGKANPRNLHNLQQETIADFKTRADAWVDKSYKQLLSEEERSVGWRVLEM